MRKQVLIKRILFTFSLFIFSPLSSDTIEWRPGKSEPGFIIDVPPDWEKDYQYKENGVILTVSKEGSIIEVRSFSVEKEYSTKELLNKKAARLSAMYSYISSVTEKYIDDNKVDTLWKLKNKGIIYYEHTVIIKKNKFVISLSCLADEIHARKYDTIFENAVISFALDYEQNDLTGNIITIPPEPAKNEVLPIIKPEEPKKDEAAVEPSPAPPAETKPVPEPEKPVKKEKKATKENKPIEPEKQEIAPDKKEATAEEKKVTPEKKEKTKKSNWSWND